MPDQNGASAAGGDLVQEFLLLAPFGALVAGVLFYAEILDDLRALAGGEHGLKGDLDPALGHGQSENQIAVLLFQGALVLVTLGQPRGGASAGQEAVNFLLVALNLFPHGFQPVLDLLAREKGVDVNVHGLLLLAFAQDLHGL
jgi:hypothetical protein